MTTPMHRKLGDISNLNVENTPSFRKGLREEFKTPSRRKEPSMRSILTGIDSPDATATPATVNKYAGDPFVSRFLNERRNTPTKPADPTMDVERIIKSSASVTEIVSSNIQQQLESLRSDVRVFRNKSEEEAKHREDAEKALADEQKLRLNVQLECQTQASKLASLEATMKAEVASRRQAEEKARSLEARAEEYRGRMEETKRLTEQELDRKQKLIAQLQQTREEAEGVSKSAKGRLEEAQKLAVTQESLLREKEQAYSSLALKYQELQNSHIRLQQIFSKTEQEQKEIVEKNNRKMSELEAKVAAGNEQVGLLNTTMDQMQKRLALTEKQLQAALGENKAMQQTVQEKEGNAEELRSALKDANTKLSLAQQQADDERKALHASNESLRKQLTTIQAAETQASALVKDTETQMVSVKKEKLNNDELLDREQKMRVQLQNELAEERSTARSATKELSEIKTYVRELEMVLKEVVQEKEMLEATLVEEHKRSEELKNGSGKKSSTPSPNPSDK